jgi:nucleoside-diphosphate-sugar epimerase
MKILVTGGAGFIGSHLVDKLVSEGNDVIAIDSLEKQVHTHFPSYLNPRANLFFGRLEDHPFLKHTLNGVKVIFHAASKVGVAQSRYEIYDFYKANVSSTAFLLQKCTDSTSKRLFSQARWRLMVRDHTFAPNTVQSTPRLELPQMFPRRVLNVSVPFAIALLRTTR